MYKEVHSSVVESAMKSGSITVKVAGRFHGYVIQENVCFIPHVAVYKSNKLRDVDAEFMTMEIAAFYVTCDRDEMKFERIVPEFQLSLENENIQAMFLNILVDTFIAQAKWQKMRRITIESRYPHMPEFLVERGFEISVTDQNSSLGLSYEGRRNVQNTSKKAGTPD